MTTDSAPSKRVLLLLVMAAFTLAHLHFLLLPDLFVAWDRQTKDRLMVLRNHWKPFRPAYHPLVAHVDLTSSGLAAMGGYALNRSQFAAVMRVLGEAGTAAQMWDFIFAARTDPLTDRALVQASRAAANVYSGLALTLGESTDKLPPVAADASYIWHPRVIGALDRFYAGTNLIGPFAEMAAASRGTGALNIQYDADGVLRRIPLFVRFRDGLVPILPLRVACDFLKVTPDRIEVRPGRHVRLLGAVTPGSGQPVDVEIPIDRQGNMRVDFIGPWGVMDHYSMAALLEAADDRDLMEVLASELAGRIVVVSDLTTGAADVGSVPGDSAYPLGGVHANILHGILTRSFIVEAGGLTMAAIEAGLMLLVGFGAMRFSSVAFTAASIGLGIAYILLAMAVFLYGQVLLGLVRPLQMLFFAVAAVLVYRYVHEEQAKVAGLRQRDEIRATFGRYLSNAVVDELMSSAEKRNLGGERRHLTFLVSDLRGFTALSAALQPEQVIDILNRCLEGMLQTIARHDGTVDEIQGDGMLVFFGAPLARGDESGRAVACAIDMQNELVRFNHEQQRRGLPPLAMGIGIHCGDVVVGNIGSEQRAKYGAVGSAINLAYRIESATTGGQVLVSEAIREALTASLLVRDSFIIQFKGIAEPIRLYSVEGLQGEVDHRMPRTAATQPLHRLTRPVEIRMAVLDGKSVPREASVVRMTAIGEDRIELRLPDGVAPNRDVKLTLRGPEATDREVVVYGKVVAGMGGTSAVTVVLTAVTPVADAVMQAWVAVDRLRHSDDPPAPPEA